MDIAELKTTVQEIIALRNEIESFSKSEISFAKSLSDYINIVHNKLMWVDHGIKDRFYSPRFFISKSLSELMDIENKKINSAFSKHKSKLLSILNRYIKEMQKGFIDYEEEMLKSTNHNF